LKRASLWILTQLIQLMLFLLMSYSEKTKMFLLILIFFNSQTRRATRFKNDLFRIILPEDFNNFCGYMNKNFVNKNKWHYIFTNWYAYLLNLYFNIIFYYTFICRTCYHIEHFLELVTRPLGNLCLWDQHENRKIK